MENFENITAAEVDKFSSKADEWWDDQGAFKTLHDINPVRLEFILASGPLNGLRVLDVGCGGGILTEAMAKQGAIVTGIDASKENIATASSHAIESELKINYYSTTAEAYADDNKNSFDLITCMELLEHVPDPVSVIKACAQMTRSGGHIMLSTINRNLKAYLFSVVAGEYLFRLLPRGTHHYKNFIRPSELVHWCNDSGLELCRLNGLSYNPLLNQCSLNTNPDVNYLMDTIVN